MWKSLPYHHMKSGYATDLTIAADQLLGIYFYNHQITNPNLLYHSNSIIFIVHAIVQVRLVQLNNQIEPYISFLLIGCY